MNNLLSEGKLLNEKGNLNEAGYSTSLIKEYNRRDIKGLKSRIKEWDYYEFNCGDYGIALTVDDNSYMSLVSVSFLDYKYKKFITKSKIHFFTFGKVGFPSTSKVGDIVYEGKDFSFKFLNDGNVRKLICEYKNFTEHSDFKCDLEVVQSTDKSMVIATPFNKNKHFYYNQKINNLIANGYFQIGERKYKVQNGIGVLDWGRGVWTYSNTWYWSSLSYQNKNGDYIGFNLGYGFGDTSKASENMLFFNKEAYKLDDVVFLIPQDEKGNYKYLEPWKFTSKQNDINLTFTPIIDRHDDTNLLILCSLQHQVFGYFNGTIKVKDKTFKIENALGFAERVTNKW